MKIGSVNFATRQGLGILMKDFYDHGIVTHPIILRHGSRHNHLEWYPPDTPCLGSQSDLRSSRILNYIREMDAMLFFETPFDWWLIKFCRDAGIKTFLMPMYECMPKKLPMVPDVIINPSLLDQDYYPEGTFIPIPVNPPTPWRQRTRALRFVHHAGHGGLRGRNGTIELVKAIPFIISEAIVEISTQDMKVFRGHEAEMRHPKIKLIPSPQDRAGLFSEADVFIFPEKFNGLSLPLQEARASGMLVMSTDRFPLNTWLPQEPLINVRSYNQACISGRCHNFEEAVIEPADIAAKIDEYYNSDITAYSDSGKQWAFENSWDVLKPRYVEILES